MNALLLFFAFFIGCIIPLQAIANHSLRVSLGSGAVFAAMVNFLIGSVVLVLVCVLSGEKWGSVFKLSSIAPWQLVGGLIGAMFVFGTTLLAPRIGLAPCCAWSRRGKSWHLSPLTGSAYWAWSSAS